MFRILMLVLCAAVFGCTPSTIGELQERQAAADVREKDRITEDQLPRMAEEVVARGNGWVTFKWQNRYFLYQHQGTHGGHSAITQLDFQPEK